MTAEFSLLLVSALATAYGFWASLRAAPKKPAAWVAALLFLAVGVLTVLHVTLSGAGELLPGYQLNPRLWQTSALVESDFMPGPRASFCFVVVLAHLLAIVALPSRATALYPLPATAWFVIYFFLAQDPTKITFAQPADGQHDTAHLTILEKDGDATLWFTIGADSHLFLKIVHRHEADGPPPDPRLRWTADGEIVTFTTRRAMPFFALDRDGGAHGWLPTKAAEWPARLPSPADSTEYRRRLSTAQVTVTKLLNEHGGPARK